MLFGLFINQKMCESENISINAAIVFEVIKQLSTLTYITKKTHENKIFTVLYANMILDQIPHFNIKERTLSKAIAELKEANLIEALDGTKMPAFAFTEKSNSYISSIKPNDGEFTTEVKSKKQPLFTLNKPTKASDLKEQYYTLLKQHGLAICSQMGVPHDEFDTFIDYHSGKGNKFANWLSAFRTWCRNYKKWNKSNDGESDDWRLYP